MTLLAVVGCATQSPPPPDVPTTRSAWAFDGTPGYEVRTPHYFIRTTVRDLAVVSRFVRVLEAAYAEYAALVPPTDAKTPPLDVYFFAQPEEWDAYTRRLAGDEAGVYLSVGPGGFAYGDQFVCWLFNESDLWSVVAHEGFHQYVARTLRQRLPPALEEGIATTFESVVVTDRSIRIDRRSNPRREQGLAGVIDEKKWLPMDTLVRMHAGDVAGRDLGVREGFYGECWALARYLLESPATAGPVRRMLADLRDGRSVVDVGAPGDRFLYRPHACRPMLEAYLTADWQRFESDVRSFAGRQLRRDE